MTTSTRVAVVVLCASLAGSAGTGAAQTIEPPFLPPDDILREIVRLSPCDIVGTSPDEVGALEIEGMRLTDGYPRFQLTAVQLPGNISSPGGLITVDTIYVPQGNGGDAGFEVLYSDSMTPPDFVAWALTGGTSWENEAHDCQRLVIASRIHQISFSPERGFNRVGSGTTMRRFGPLVGIFPLDSAMALDERWSEAMPVATVYNWGGRSFQEMPYGPLGVGDGWHCLWMRYVDDEWQAALVPTEVVCPRADSPPPDSAWNLVVRESIHGQRTASRLQRSDVYPHSARWGWDADSLRHYIGIRCGTAWCSIGRSAPPVAARLLGDPYRVIPGWRDEQLLAVEGSDQSLFPGPLGVLEPDSAYWRLSRPRLLGHPYLARPVAGRQPPTIASTSLSLAMARPSGLTVANIAVMGSATQVASYTAKFGLVPQDGAWRGSVTIQGDVSPESAWFGPNGVPAELQFVPEIDHSVVGAVRWRWRERDEQVWASCEDGCCTVRPALP